ncbi:hypothetical protein B0H13DRAFT_2069107 [Mycena leptocephala]|nr:hypothetical protein B0H13DRAFT_2069107 [Mycena leptocephala]
MFCTHFKEVCTDCNFDGREENDAFLTLTATGSIFSKPMSRRIDIMRASAQPTEKKASEIKGRR